MLSPFQTELAAIVAKVAAPEGFALAGGGALIAHGLVDRTTKDLDYFAPPPEVVATTSRVVEAVLQKAGYEVARKVDVEGFVRLEVRRGNEACELDFGQDARRWPVVDQTNLGPVVAREELAADKTLALLGRAAARDFIDVQALERLFGGDRLCELALDKDPGFRRVYLADAVAKFDRLDREQFEVDDHGYRELRQWAAHWKILLIEQSRHIEQERGILQSRERDGPEISL